MDHLHEIWWSLVLKLSGLLFYMSKNVFLQKSEFSCPVPNSQFLLVTATFFIKWFQQVSVSSYAYILVIDSHICGESGILDD